MFRNFVAGFAAVLLSMTALYAGQPEQNSFKETTAKLDAGGPFYLYYGSERFCSSLDGKINSIRDIFLESIPAEDFEQKAALTKGFALASSLVKGFGLTEISGAGASSLSLGDNLYRNRFFLHHYPDNGQGILWKLFGKAPHSLNDELSMLPADTALAQFADFDAKLLWHFLKSEAEKSGSNKFKKALVDFEASLIKNEVDLNQLLESCDGSSGFLLTLKQDRMTVIPLGINKMAQIPQPGIALFVKVKNDYLFSVLKKKLACFIPKPAPGAAQMKVDENRIDISFPFPLPVPFMPVIVKEDGYVIAATNPELLDSILAAKKGGSGLVNTPEFKTLSADIPENGNGFKFVSEKFAKTIADIQSQSINPAGAGMTKSSAFNKLNIMSDLKVYGVWQVLDDGILASSNSNFSIGDTLLLQVAVAPAAIAAGMLLPALNTAREKARRVNCASNLKQIGLALKQYSMDNGDNFPKADGAAGLEEFRKGDYLTDYKVYTCPSSKTLPAANRQPLSEANVSYVYFGGFAEKDNLDMPIAFDKPANHKNFVNVLFLDGHVQGFPGFFRNCTDVVNMLKKQNNYSADDIKRLDEKAAIFDAPPQGK